MNNLKATRIVRFSLLPDTFRWVSSLHTTKIIWDRLEELYSSDVNLTRSIQTRILSEFGY